MPLADPIANMKSIRKDLREIEPATDIAQANRRIQDLKNCVSRMAWLLERHLEESRQETQIG